MRHWATWVTPVIFAGLCFLAAGLEATLVTTLACVAIYGVFRLGGPFREHDRTA